MPARIHVEGLDELRRSLGGAEPGLKRQVKDANKQLAQKIVAKALPRVPVRSGRLKRSVRASGTQRDAIGRAGTARVPYAAAIHWGTRQYRGRPFLREAAEAVEQDAIREYEQAVQAVIDTISAR